MNYNEISNIIMQNMYGCMKYFINNKIDFINEILPKLIVSCQIKINMIENYNKNILINLIIVLNKIIKCKKSHLIKHKILKLIE